MFQCYAVLWNKTAMILFRSVDPFLIDFPLLKMGNASLKWNILLCTHFKIHGTY